MTVDFLTERFERCADETAIVAPVGRCSFSELVELIRGLGAA